MENLFEGNNWDTTRETLLDGLDGNKRDVMSTVLENTKQALTESSAAGSTTAGNMATLNKVILPIIRRVMPTVIANEIIGVQPMTGPVGQIHSLRVRYAETTGGATAGSEALSPFDIANSYSGDGSAAPAATASIMAALAMEITAEIDQEILTSLGNLATGTASFDQNAVTGTPTFVGDEHAALATLMNREANLIAQRTRRGAANWAVVSPAALTVLQSATTSAFARTTEGTFEAPTNTKFVGTLNGTMRIYVNTYANDATPVLLGYKGSGEIDAAAFYCPYVPLMSSGVVVDPSTFEPVVSFMTRYGYVELNNTASSLGNAADYVSKIAMSNLSFV